MQQNTNDQSASLRRTRSPAYPSTDLRDAVEKAEALWNKVGKHEAGRDVVAEVWGFSESSSAVPQYLAALKRYGLLEDVGDGKRRLVKLTPLAVKIIAHGPESTERKTALKIAALKPAVFEMLLRRYSDNLSVADSLIKSHLIADLDFNKDAVPGLIKAFRDTITFADLTSEDVKTEKDSSDNQPSTEEKKSSSELIVLDNSDKAGKVVFQEPLKLFVKTPEHMRDFTLPMPNGGIHIRVPASFSEADFLIFKKSLDLFKDWLVSEKEPQHNDQSETTSSPEEQ